MKNFILTGLLLISTFPLYSQDFDFELEPNFETTADVTAATENYLTAAKWLISSPHDPDNSDWKKVGAYTLAWISATDSFGVTLSQEMLSFSEDNSSLLLIFTAAWGIHALENPEDLDDPAACCFAAITVVLDYAESNESSLENSRSLRKLQRLQRKGELEEWAVDVIPKR
ncbi:hypothetical protein [Phaeocystidibacter marisrubri]|uniref:Uncharacterized protein n=1 Tax=Phaeocystidibacter marisrubri TaxID=1577780 RepID=A0A6L3ZE82_9FLAO|nr:hypothetical protein [Phaeocystidibacter marisrubri]KAB2815754.1 hypothetical protein F8C82_08625 [Phaeocystidibacter marisrubri]GGH65534.1 hypothetical protein GCM10011318_02630 [Phaeocystidibacter marisrubri]